MKIVIGPKMWRAVSIVQTHPGCSKLFVARQLHPACANGSNNALGYDPINRAIKAGLIIAEHLKNGSYSLTVKDSAPTRDDPLPGADTAGAVATNGGAPFSQSPP